jgi:hypothetical protein
VPIDCAYFAGAAVKWDYLLDNTHCSGQLMRRS